MSIEPFIQEIESRKKSDMSTLEKELNEKKSEIKNKKNTVIQELKDNYEKEAKLRSEREAARILEGGKLEAKKIVFDAINKNLDSTFEIIKKDLGKYTQNSEYKNILEQMIKTSKNALGKNITIHFKEEDKSLFNDSEVTLGSTIQTLGGIVAENSDGTKELDLTFEELLRSNEDEIKSSILEKIL
jgi:vacuolar-type H+-ATPase subunit E/Vma4